jgi:hypothetical protein
MRFKFVLFFLCLIPQISQGEAPVCQQLFQFPKEEPVKTEIRLEYENPNVLKLFRKINLVFLEYPRGYMENTPTVAKITVPESRWQEIFVQDYQAVISELSKVQIYKVETFADGTQTRVFDAPFLKSFRNDEVKTFPNEWVTTQRSQTFEFDRRVLKIIETYLEPAHVAYILELGVIEKKMKNKSG